MSIISVKISFTKNYGSRIENEALQLIAVLVQPSTRRQVIAWVSQATDTTRAEKNIIQRLVAELYGFIGQQVTKHAVAIATNYVRSLQRLALIDSKIERCRFSRKRSPACFDRLL
jgi:hypothetical protein